MELVVLETLLLRQLVLQVLGEHCSTRRASAATAQAGVFEKVVALHNA